MKKPTKIEWYGKEVNMETRKVVHKKIRQSVFLVFGDVVMNMPVVSGRARDSVDTAFKEFIGLVYSNVDYMPMIELGTEPHWIGRSVKIGNSWRYIGMHPGTEAQPVFRSALFDNENNIKRIFNDNKL